MANQKLISIDDAKLQTLSVEVKTLTIGRKQMTLAVFRQLPTEDLFDLSDAQLRFNGLVWGRVNYHWTGCDAASSGHPHMHVIWQRGALLVQSCVYEPFRVTRSSPSPSPDKTLQNAFGAEYCTVSWRSGEETVVRTAWLETFLTACPIEHPLYATRYAELQALDQLFIAV